MKTWTGGDGGWDDFDLDNDIKTTPAVSSAIPTEVRLSHEAVLVFERCMLKSLTVCWVWVCWMMCQVQPAENKGALSKFINQCDEEIQTQFGLVGHGPWENPTCVALCNDAYESEPFCQQSVFGRWILQDQMVGMTLISVEETKHLGGTWHSSLRIPRFKEVPWQSLWFNYQELADNFCKCIGCQWPQPTHSWEFQFNVALDSLTRHQTLPQQPMVEVC